MIRLLYSALWWVGLPVVLLRLWRRGGREPEYRRHIAERLGFYDRSAHQPASPLIWVHAVSVGETRAAQPLIEALLTAYPQHAILLTHMTATGRATGRQLFAGHGDRVIQSYFPYDTGWMCARFLRHFKPRICILMETEVWPNMLHRCRRRHIPVLLANARLSARSLRRSRRFGALLREAAAGIDCVAAQSERDAERLRLAGARRVHVTGNIKFDVAAPADMVALGKQWRAQSGARPVLLCASTRAGEEESILQALSRIGRSNFLTIIVPRHPQRFDEVAAMIAAHGFVMQRRSHGMQVAAATDIVLGDSMGEMFAWYAMCDIAFIGGSLLPLGGQNPIEACLLGKPVLIGAHTFNFQVISHAAVTAQAALRVTDAAEMLHQAQSLFDDHDRRAAMSRHAVAFARKQQGATAHTMALVVSMLH